MEYNLYHIIFNKMIYKIKSNRIVHEFEEIFLKLVSGERSLNGVILNVWGKPCLLPFATTRWIFESFTPEINCGCYKNIECMSYHSCHENIHIRFLRGKKIYQEIGTTVD